MRTLLFHFSRLWTALILVTFAGCSSGGNTIDVSLTSTGSQAQAQSTKEADSATQFVENSQYIGQMGLGMMKAAAAYSQGGSGKDVAIGFVDTALDNTHEEFSDGRIIFHDKTAYEETERTAEHQQHATKVVSLAAGSRLAGENMHGVAYEADIAMWELLLKDNGYLKLNANILEKAYTALGNAGSDIINNSWATSLVFQPEEISASQDFLKWYFGDALEVMKQANIIYVWASGNGGEAEVKRTAALPLLFPELSNKMLIVTAVNAEGEIDSISNHCGSLADWCISAPGGYDERMVTAAMPEGKYGGVFGTSFAAAHISGALALLKHLFAGQLSNEDILARLLATANKQGIYQEKSIYGQGLVDLEAATRPVGESQIISNGNIATATAYAVSQSALLLDGLGSGVLANLEGVAFTIFDELGAPFEISLKNFLPKRRGEHITKWISEVKKGEQSYQQMQAMGLGFLPVRLRKKLTATKSWNFTGSIGMDEEGMLAEGGIYMERVKKGVSIMSGINFSRQGLARAGEKGIRGAGAFEIGGYHQSMFLSLRRHIQFSSRQALHWNMQMGVSSAERGSSFLELSPVIWAGFEARFTHSLNAKKQLQFRFAQPMRIIEGDMKLHLAKSRTPEGEIKMETETLSLVPKGRELFFEAMLKHKDKHGSILFGVRLTHDVGHDVRSKNMLSLLAIFQERF